MACIRAPLIRRGNLHPKLLSHPFQASAFSDCIAATDAKQWLINVSHCTQELPRGHPECLTGKTFVITGVLESMWRDDAMDLIKRHSGRVTGSVSGKTTFLLSGDQAGKSKTALVKLLSHAHQDKRSVVLMP